MQPGDFILAVNNQGWNDVRKMREILESERTVKLVVIKAQQGLLYQKYLRLHRARMKEEAAQQEAEQEQIRAALALSSGSEKDAKTQKQEQGGGSSNLRSNLRNSGRNFAFGSSFAGTGGTGTAFGNSSKNWGLGSRLLNGGLGSGGLGSGRILGNSNSLLFKPLGGPLGGAFGSGTGTGKSLLWGGNGNRNSPYNNFLMMNNNTKKSNFMMNAEEVEDDSDFLGRKKKGAGARGERGRGERGERDEEEEKEPLICVVSPDGSHNSMICGSEIAYVLDSMPPVYVLKTGKLVEAVVEEKVDFFNSSTNGTNAANAQGSQDRSSVQFKKQSMEDRSNVLKNSDQFEFAHLNRFQFSKIGNPRGSIFTTAGGVAGGGILGPQGNDTNTNAMLQNVSNELTNRIQIKYAQQTHGEGGNDNEHYAQTYEGQTHEEITGGFGDEGFNNNDNNFFPGSGPGSDMNRGNAPGYGFQNVNYGGKVGYGGQQSSNVQHYLDVPASYHDLQSQHILEKYLKGIQISGGSGSGKGNPNTITNGLSPTGKAMQDFIHNNSVGAVDGFDINKINQMLAVLVIVVVYKYHNHFSV